MTTGVNLAIEDADTACAQERIDLPGSIQPHGVLWSR